MDKTLQEAIEQLRALEAAGEDPRNANQRWDVTPEQAGALLAHLDDVEQKRAEAVRSIADRLLELSDGSNFDSLQDLQEELTQYAMELWPAPAQEASDGK